MEPKIKPNDKGCMPSLDRLISGRQPEDIKKLVDLVAKYPVRSLATKPPELILQTSK